MCISLALQDQIVNYWIQKEKLPQNLSELEDNITGFVVPKDPEQELAYEYNITASLSFELCATFKTSSKDFGASYQGAGYLYPYDSFQQNWDHEAEKTCFARTIDPDLYKNNERLKAPLPIQD